MSQVNITVEEFVNTYRDIIGNAADSQCSIDLINKARIIAYPMSDFDGSMAYEPIGVNLGGRLVLPAHLDTIRLARYCNGKGVEISRDEYMDSVYFESCMEDILVRMEGKSYLPFVLDIDNQYPMYFFAVNMHDAGKVMEVSYIDAAGTHHDEEVTLLPNQAVTRLRHAPSKVSRIKKGSTKGRIGVSVNQLTEYLEARDKVPTYSVYCTNDVCSCYLAIKAKKKYIPYTLDDLNEVLDVNPEALSTLIIAVKKKSSNPQNWFQEYSATVEIARKFLAAEVRNKENTRQGIQAVTFDNAFMDSIEQP
jgi:hypothetical protein